LALHSSNTGEHRLRFPTRCTHPGDVAPGTDGRPALPVRQKRVFPKDVGREFEGEIGLAADTGATFPLCPYGNLVGYLLRQDGSEAT